VNPIDAIKAQIEQIKDDVRVQVETAILRESIRFQASRR
jgi:hypothetical protein